MKKHDIDISEPIPENPEFADQSLARAYSLCLRVMAKYACRASEGKLGGIKRNRNNWKSSAASECAEIIAALDETITSSHTKR